MPEPRAPLEPPDLAAIRERRETWTAPHYDAEAIIDALLAHIKAQDARIAELTADRQWYFEGAAHADKRIAEQQSEIDRLRELLREARGFMPGFGVDDSLYERVAAALSERPKS